MHLWDGFVNFVGYVGPLLLALFIIPAWLAPFPLRLKVTSTILITSFYAIFITAVLTRFGSTPWNYLGGPLVVSVIALTLYVLGLLYGHFATNRIGISKTVVSAFLLFYAPLYGLAALSWIAAVFLLPQVALMGLAWFWGTLVAGLVSNRHTSIE